MVHVTKHSSGSDTAISSSWERFQLSARSDTQRTIAGVTISAPTTSPSHHVIQISSYLCQSAYPPRARLVTPKVALTAVLNTAAKSKNLIVSPCWVKHFRPFAKE